MNVETLGVCTMQGKAVLPFYCESAKDMEQWSQAFNREYATASATRDPSATMAQPEPVAKPLTSALIQPSDEGSADPVPTLASGVPLPANVASTHDPSPSSKPSTASKDVRSDTTSKSKRWGDENRNPSLGKSAEYCRYDSVTVKPRLRGEV